MKIIALYHIKGGVGKTAASVNLALCAARDGFKTLLCDLDPQGSASFYFRILPEKKFTGKVFLRGGKKVDKNIKGTDFENLDLLPADFSFRKMDISLDHFTHSKKRLIPIFQKFKNEYDFIFLDCPPNITLVSENIFRAADVVLVPVIPTTLSILTFDKLCRFFKKKKLTSSKILAFFSMAEIRKQLHKEIMKNRLAADQHFLKEVIPYASIVEKMGVYREPVVSYRPNSKAAQAYQHLWAAVCADLQIN